jgi:hypothetical protein
VPCGTECEGLNDPHFAATLLRSRMTHRAWRHTPSQAVFSGIILSPPGNYIIEARSVDDPQIFVHTAEPTTICKWNVRKPTRHVMMLRGVAFAPAGKVTDDKKEKQRILLTYTFGHRSIHDEGQRGGRRHLQRDE